MSHTPGPWEVDRKQQGYWPYVVRGESGGFSVVDREGDRERARADAALIASAPATSDAASAMLAALHGQVTLLEHYAARLRNVHVLMAREMEMDVARLRSNIAQAETAGIKAES